MPRQASLQNPSTYSYLTERGGNAAIAAQHQKVMIITSMWTMTLKTKTKISCTYSPDIVEIERISHGISRALDTRHPTTMTETRDTR